MGVAVYLEAAPGRVEPGFQTSVGITVRNTGAVVDQIDLDIVGDTSEWASVQPASVNLLPGEEADARLTFAPPRTPGMTAGGYAFALRAMSREDTGGSVIEEAVVEVGEFSLVEAEIIPRTSTGRRAGRHRLAVDNLGNHAETVSVGAVDPDQKLKFAIRPANLTVPPGSATFVTVSARPRKTFWRGANASLPFEVTATPATTAPATLPATMVQQAILPAWLPKALAAVVLLGVALVALWYTLLKPTVESSARAVVEDETRELARAIVDASEQADQAQEEAAAAQEQAAAAEESAVEAEETVEEATQGGGAGRNGAGSGGNVPVGTLDSRAALDFRISTEVPSAGGFTPEDFVPPARRVVWVSDLVLQNPAGDAGSLRIQRGDTVLLEFGLENFRDLDYHFIQPAQFDEDNPVVVAVDCTNQATIDVVRPCRPSVYFSGQSQRIRRAGNRAAG